MARGIVTRNDILTTVNGVELNDIWNEAQEALNQFNQGKDSLLGLFTFNTTNAAEAVPQITSPDDFEEESQFGIAKTMRAPLVPTTLGYPLRWYDTRGSFTEQFLRDADSAQVEAEHAAKLEADDRNVFRKAMQALLFKPAATGDRLANENGVPIYGLWDGLSDSQPPAFAGQTFAAGHDHYLTSGATVVDGGDLRDVIEHIQHHNYGVATGERIVLLMHPNLSAVVRGFRVASGSPYDFIPAEGAPSYLSTEQIIGTRAPATFNNMPVVGSFGPALIIESRFVPNGYVIGVATSGPNSARNVLALRQHIRPELQGLRLLPGSAHLPIQDSRYQHGFGVGVRNRGAAVVMQITTSATYTAPQVP